MRFLALSLLLSWFAACATERTSAHAPARSSDLRGRSSEGLVAGDSAEESEKAERVAVQRDRKLIYSAELQLQVSQVEPAIERYLDEVEALGGYMAQRDGDAITVRVPADKFEQALERAKSLGRVLHERVQVDDVTEQHTDLRIRLDNASKARQRLLALLERADKVEDILAIETELSRLTTEIERLTAQLENLENRIAMSTIRVQMHGATPDQHTRRPSRFEWINGIGAEYVRTWF